MGEISRDKAMKRKPGLTPHIGLEIGKVPPNAINAEISILAAAIMEQELRVVAIENLDANMFYREEHRHVFAAIVEMNTERKAVDLVSLMEKLKTMEKLDLVGGAYFVTGLAEKFTGSSFVNLEGWIDIVQQKHQLRELIRVAGTIYHEAFNDAASPELLLREMEGGAVMIDGQVVQKSKHIATWAEATEAANERYKMIKELGGKLTGVPTGFPELDELTAGWQGGDLIILGGRPAMGKSALAEYFALWPAMSQKLPTAFFSLEMPNQTVITRGQSIFHDWDHEQIQRGKLSPEREEELMTSARFRDLPIFLDDTPNIDIHVLRNRIIKWVREHGVGLVVIDYLQLIKGLDPERMLGNTNHQIGYYTKVLKGLAKELSIPIIVLAQLSREVETRKKSIPRLSDLRDSGEIEQDADLIAFVYRPEYYGIDMTDPIKSKNNAVFSTEGLGQILVQKHRNGDTDNIICMFDGPKMKWHPAHPEDLQERLRDGAMETTPYIPPPQPSDDGEAPF